MKSPNFLLQSMVFCIILIATQSFATINEISIDFRDKKDYCIHCPITQNDGWISIKHGERFIVEATGLVFPNEAGCSLTYNYPVKVSKNGDVVCLQIDFTYGQVEGAKNTDLFQIGFTNGESELKAYLKSQWGSNLAFGCTGRSVGEVMHTRDFEFDDFKTQGTSQKLRFSVSLTKKKGGLWDMGMYLQNLDREDAQPRYWTEKNMFFAKGSNTVLNVIIENGLELKEGIAQKTISNLYISSDKLPIPEKDWNGVDFVSYFKPIESQSPLVEETWGNRNVLPRDTANGLEDADLSHWCYWDGSIVKDDKGLYHIYASRWPQMVSHREGWTIHSKGTHAISDNPLGPYRDLGLIYPEWKNGKGSNVIGLRTHEGKYAVVTSEITKGEIFLSDNPYGPFSLLGEIKVDYNGFSPNYVAYREGKGNMSNVMILPMPDGKRYMLVPRYASVMISDSGIQGPYKVVSDPVYFNRPELHKTHNEDPTVWFSGERYYILYNHWPSKTCHFFSSEDGINNWTYRGVAFKKGDSKIFKYTNGTVNMWEFVERPTAFVENGHVTHFIFSVLDVNKGADGANDNHGSKIVVVPFDGEAFDRDMQEIVDQENAITNKSKVH